MIGPFEVDGYDVLAPLGDSGRCWRALCLADGRRVVLRRCVAAAPLLGEVRRRAAVWGSVPGGGVVPVRDVAQVGADLVIVTELAAGGGFDVLLSRRPKLSPGQVVTLVVGVGETLAAAHERGLVHGRISAATVVLDDDGRPLLADHSLAAAVEPTADVTALCALALEHLDDHAPAALTEVLRAFENVPAGTSSPARALVDQVRAIAPAEPLLAAPSIGDVDERSLLNDGTPRTLLRPAIALSAVVAVAAVVVGGLRVMPHNRAHPTALAPVTPPPTPSLLVDTAPSPGTATSEPDWRAIVERLEARRLRALTDDDERRLATAEVRGTMLWSRDMRVMTRVRTGHARVDSRRVAVHHVRVVSASPRRVVLRVNDALSVEPVLLVLVRDHADWLVRAVRSA